MSAEREMLARELFAGAVELPVSEREAFLCARCADESLRAELRSLLGHHETAGAGFLERPDADAVPERIGPYRIVRLIGRGGFGSVYEALQERPVRRRVAVKVLRAGLDTAEVVQRFSAERQALALMTHPGIARVFDAGATERGRPYFVMEYVDGPPITEYSATLGTPKRLALFIGVCMAVQHAHQKGVIHRDLKPSNILVETVDGRPCPRIIDFGIAKAMDEEPGAEFTTRRGQLIGTPGYMSPEQARGQDIDTRTDIYSLGAVLYQLLAGEPPFDPQELARASPAELERLLTQGEPQTPSARVRSRICPPGQGEGAMPHALASTLRGDLDAIVLKAMDPDRDRRYDSAAALAADLQRHLDHEPVIARPPSRAYRVKKFARRNRVALGAVSGIGAAILIGLGAAVYGLVQASRQRDEARREARVLEGVVGFTTNQLLRSADPRAAGRRDVTVLEAMTDAASRIQGRFTEEPLVEAAIRLAIGEIQRSLGQNAEAGAQIERAISIRTQRLGAEHAQTLDAVRELGVVYDEQGRHEDAAGLFRRVLDARTRDLGPDHALTLQALNDLAVAEERCGRFAASEGLLRRAWEARKRSLGPDHPDTLLVLNNIATVLLVQERYDEARPLAQAAADGMIRARTADDPTALDCRNTLGVVALRQGRVEEAAAILRENLDRRRRVLGTEHLKTADSLSNLGECLCGMPGSAPEAEGLLRQCLAIRESRLPAGHWAVANARSLLGQSLILLGRYAEAEPLLVQGYEGLQDSSEAPPDRVRRAGERIVALCEAWGKPEQATRWRDRLALRRDSPDSR